MILCVSDSTTLDADVFVLCQSLRLYVRSLRALDTSGVRGVRGNPRCVWMPVLRVGVLCASLCHCVFGIGNMVALSDLQRCRNLSR